MSSNALRILIIVTRMDTGGVPEHIWMLVRGLQEQGHDITIACRDITDRYRLPLEAIGVKIQLAPLARLPNPYTDLKALFFLFKYIKKGQFDIVHTHMSKAVMIGGVAATLARVPGVVNTAHNIGWIALSNPLYRAIFWIYDSLLFRLATDKVITVSDYVRKRMISAHILSSDRVCFIPNGIDVPVLSPGFDIIEKKSELGIAQDVPVVTTVARLVWFKGIDKLVDSVVLVKREFPNVMFVIIGDGELRQALEAQAKSLGVSDSILFLGERDDVPEILAISDLFVLPSVSEGMPISILEAMAQKMPVVATSVGGVPELVESGVNGELIEVGQVELFAKAIIKILGNDLLSKQYGENSKKKHRSLFSYQSMVDATIDVYRNLLNK